MAPSSVSIQLPPHKLSIGFQMRRIVVLVLVALCIFLGLGYSWSESHWSGRTMGTTYSVHVFLPWYLQQNRPKVNITELAELVEQRLHVINNSMSTYISDSEISRFNHAPVQSEQCNQVSPEFFDVLKIAQHINQQIPLFDITLGPLINLWGFGGESKITLEWQPPSPKAIQQVLSRIGFSRLKIAESNCVYKLAEVELDVSSIAKGYAVDDIAREFRSQGVEHFLIEIGGEVYASGHKPGLRPWFSARSWNIGIESPISEKLESQAPEINPIVLQDLAVATSGDYRNYFEYNGISYSHILNPETGNPVTSEKSAMQRLTSVSVVHESTALADGLATALFALGYNKAKAFVVSQKLRVALVSLDDNHRVQTWVSPDLKELLLEP